MGWSIGYDDNWKRDVGYSVPATCDHPGCNEVIDRGLSYVCGGEPFGGDRGCGLYFCSRHLTMSARLPQLCSRCLRKRPPFKPTPDVPSWRLHRLMHWSWREWREENGIVVLNDQPLYPTTPAARLDRPANTNGGT